MLLSSSVWASLGLLFLGVRGASDLDDIPNSWNFNHSTVHEPFCSSNVTIIDTTTVVEATTTSVTHHVDVIVSSTTTIVLTESTTTTLKCTVSVTETDSATITNTETATATVPATVTTYTTTTIVETSLDPCPSTCSMSVGTVNLYFWPTDRPYTYPSTYFDESLDYTFTSPSVYMLIPTAKGTNSLGPAGPSTSKWILPLDLGEVSTVVDGSITRQLTLSDIGTDCPQTANPSAIATIVDSRCDPILAAPSQVRSWAYPCNACGRFGLFDPPYAVPPLTGGLIVTTPVATAAPVGTILVVHYNSDGEPMSTDTIKTTGMTGTVTSSVTDPATSTANPGTGIVSTPVLPTTNSPVSTPATQNATSPSNVATAAATKLLGGSVWVMSSSMLVAFLVYL